MIKLIIWVCMIYLKFMKGIYDIMKFNKGIYEILPKKKN